MPIAMPEIVLQAGALQGFENRIEPVPVSPEAVAIGVEEDRGESGRAARVLGLQLSEGVEGGRVQRNMALGLSVLGGAGRDLFLIKVNITPLQSPLLRGTEAGMQADEQCRDVFGEALAQGGDEDPLLLIRQEPGAAFALLLSLDRASRVISILSLSTPTRNTSKNAACQRLRVALDHSRSVVCVSSQSWISSLPMSTFRWSKSLPMIVSFSSSSCVLRSPFCSRLCFSASLDSSPKVMFRRNFSGSFLRANFSARRLPISVIASDRRPTFSVMRRPLAQCT
jgi:hypothetical protein